MVQLIILGDVDYVDRKELEMIEGNTYNSYEEFKELEDIAKHVSSYTTSDFMDAVNDQLIDNLTEHWIGYIYIK
jgi:hypothetical protein